MGASENMSSTVEEKETLKRTLLWYCSYQSIVINIVLLRPHLHDIGSIPA